MRKNSIRLLLTSILIISSTGLFAQAPVHETDDPSIIYTKVEVNASFKGGSDTLNKYLTENVNTKHARDGETGLAIFIVSKTGTIDDVQIPLGNLHFKKDLQRVLLASSGMWNSATQNNYHVRAYCKLKITFRNNKIEAEIE